MGKLILIKNNLLEQLVEEASQVPFNPELVAERNRAYQEREGSVSQPVLTLDTWRKFSGEHHLDIALHEIAEDHPEFEISFKPVEEGRKRFFTYSYTDGPTERLIVETKGCDFPHVYDSVINVNDTPVVFKLRLGQNRTKKGRKTLTKERYCRELKPLVRFFGERISYVVFFSKDVYDRMVWGKRSGVHRFRQRGGIVAPFRYEREEFRDMVRNLVADYNLGEVRKD